MTLSKTTRIEIFSFVGILPLKNTSTVFKNKIQNIGSSQEVL